MKHQHVHVTMGRDCRLEQHKFDIEAIVNLNENTEFLLRAWLFDNKGETARNHFTALVIQSEIITIDYDLSENMYIQRVSAKNKQASAFHVACWKDE